jgi:hypothetical protein
VKLSILTTMKKVYTTKKINSTSGTGSDRKVLLAQIILIICILILIAAKSFT